MSSRLEVTWLEKADNPFSAHTQQSKGENNALYLSVIIIFGGLSIAVALLCTEVHFVIIIFGGQPLSLCSF